MAKPEKAKRQSFYVINIKLRNKLSKKDLTKEDYANLFRRLWLAKKIHKESSPQKHCIIKSLYEVTEKGEVQYFAGLLAQFTWIENESWFNLDSLEAEENFQLPDNLFPDLVVTDYVFIPAAHRFLFYTNSQIAISPYPVKKFLEKALDEVTLPNEMVHVDVETSHDGIQKIKRASEIKWLKIDVNYSNLDTSNSIQKFFDDNMRNSNTGEISLHAKAKQGTSLEIANSEILSGALDTAKSNGDAEARIMEDNHWITVKTSDYPLKETIFGVTSRFSQLAYEKVMRIFRNQE